MHDDFLHYFERELTFLREMGKEFALKYPKVAGRLLLEPGKCEDPHVERLIEAFALLCARVQRKIDDGFPEITQSLLQVLYPQLTAPIPSLSVVKFAPLLGNLPACGHRIARGTPLYSKPVNGIPCRFRTVYPVTIRPIEVVDARIEEPAKLFKGAQQMVRIRLRFHNGADFNGFKGDGLRFYLNGPPQHVFPLYQLLLNHSCRVECVPAGVPTAAVPPLPPGCLRPVGFGADEDLLPYPDQAFPGYRLLLEYFALPQKFLFFDCTGLSVLETGAQRELSDLLFYLDRPVPESLAIGPETFCLHATPVVNAFGMVAEPIRHDQRKTEYRVVPDLRREDGMEVLSVDEVTAAAATSFSKVKRYRPVFSLRDGGEADENALWHLQRRPSSRRHDAGTEVFLSFRSFEGDAAVPKEETVLVRITCSNRDLPAKLSCGDPSGDFETETAAPLAAIHGLLKPTASLRPSRDGAQQRRLISHLSLNYLSLVEGGAGALREILSLYDFCGSLTTRQQINGIASVTSRPVTRRIGAGFCRGVEVTLQFDEEKYVGSGLYLFASVLERFLGAYVSVNSFVQMTASSTSGRVIKQWPPRNGDRALL